MSEKCPQYFTRTTKNTCQKNPCPSDDDACKKGVMSTLRWSGYAISQYTPPRGFRFRYSLTGFRSGILFNFRLKGPDNHFFTIERNGRGKVSLVNARRLPKGKKFRIQLESDVIDPQRGYLLVDKYVWVFHFFVSS